MLYINGRFLTQPVSGVQRYARELLTALDGQVEAQVLVPHPVCAPDWDSLTVRVVPGSRGHVWEQTTLARAARTGRLLSLCNSGPLSHNDHVLCLHDAHLFEMAQAFSPAYRMLHRHLRPALARRAVQLMTVSAHSARQLSHHLKVPKQRFHIVPNAAEHVHAWPEQHDVCTRHGLVPNGYLLSVGNQSPNKNIAALIRAHAQAGRDVPPLAVVGGVAPGVTAAYPEGARMLGRVPDHDLRGLYEGAAGFVFPSLNEGFGIPPLEAMELGVLVLCARAGAMPEVLGNAPLWFDPRSGQDMTEALQRFTRLSAAERYTMRMRGKAVAAQYRWAYSGQKLMALLMEKEVKQAA